MNKEQIESEREMVCHMASRILAGLYAGGYVGEESGRYIKGSGTDAVNAAVGLAHAVVDKVGVPSSRRAEGIHCPSCGAVKDISSLLPCPFCGSDDLEIDGREQVYCNQCGGSTDTTLGKDEAIRRWNRRAKA